MPSTTLPSCTAIAAVKAPPSLEQHESRLARMSAEAQRLVMDAERGGAELVGRAEIDAVDLAMLWVRYRGE
jgi:hypothetical protein